MKQIHILVEDGLARELRSKYGHGEVAKLVREFLGGLVGAGDVKVSREANRVSAKVLSSTMNPMMEEFLKKQGKK